MINMKNFRKIIRKKQIFMEKTITNMIRHYGNCYFKISENSVMLVRCLSKTENRVHNFKGFYHFYLNELYISTTVWNKHTSQFVYSQIKL